MVFILQLDNECINDFTQKGNWVTQVS